METFIEILKVIGWIIFGWIIFDIIFLSYLWLIKKNISDVDIEDKNI